MDDRSKPLIPSIQYRVEQALKLNKLMEKREKSYCIIKVMGDKEVNMSDTHGEVLEFPTFEEADEMATLMEVNSDSGYEYKVKEI